ncbi:MAG: hypothetical protein ACP5XB_11405 [Isosphaeraceae bacterium]
MVYKVQTALPVPTSGARPPASARVCRWAVSHSRGFRSHRRSVWNSENSSAVSRPTDYQQRQRAGLWIASTRVEKDNDWAVSGRCKHQGMSWSPEGVLALAALEAARRNGEIDAWRRDRVLPEQRLSEPVGKAA